MNDLIDCLRDRGSLQIGLYIDGAFSVYDDSQIQGYGMIDLENDFENCSAHDVVATGFEIDRLTGNLLHLLVKDGNNRKHGKSSDTDDTSKYTHNAMRIDINMHPEIANMTIIPPEYRDKYKPIEKTPMIYSYELYREIFAKQWKIWQEKNTESTIENEKEFMNSRSFIIAMYFGGHSDTIPFLSHFSIVRNYGGKYIDYDYTSLS